MEKLVLRNIERQLESKAVIRHSQHGFIKMRSGLNNLRAQILDPS